MSRELAAAQSVGATASSVSHRLDRLRFKSKTYPIFFLNQEYIYSIRLVKSTFKITDYANTCHTNSARLMVSSIFIISAIYLVQYCIVCE